VTDLSGHRGTARAPTAGMTPDLDTATSGGPAAPGAGDDRPHIVAVVFNSISHDARVLKEARSLRDAGARVTVVGIRDRRAETPHEILEPGIELVRVEHRDRIHAIVARLWSGFAVLGGLAALVVTGLALRGLQAAFSGGTGVLASIVDWRGWFVVLPAAAAAAAVAGLGVLRARRHRAAARLLRLRAEGEGGGPAAPSPSRSWMRCRAGRLMSEFRSAVGRRAIHDAVVDALRGMSIDGIHGHEPQGLEVAAALRAERPGLPVVYDAHELYDEQAGITEFRRRRLRRRLRTLSRVPSGAISVNASIAREMTVRWPAMPEPVVVRNACPLPERPPQDDGRLRAAAGLGPDEGRILLYQGGYAHGRGLQELVRAAAHLPAGWTLVMMGWGAIEPQLRAIAAEVDPGGTRCRFIPGAPQAELPAWTAGADLGVIPYRNTCLNHWYCTPNKLWEYPAAGVPMLVSPFPELRAVVEAWELGGLLDDPLTPEGIAAAVATCSGPEGDARLAAMGKRCRRFLEQDHWGVQGARLVELWRSAGLPLASAESPDVGASGDGDGDVERAGPTVTTVAAPSAAAAGGRRG